jgi:acetylornithine deacetylase
MPFPAIKIGPGESRRSHTADEFVELHEVALGVETYYKIINNLADIIHG